MNPSHNPSQQPDRPGIEARSLDIIEHNTIAVLTDAPDRLDRWRATLTQALEDTLARSPGDVAEIALFRALLALLEGDGASLPEGHRYAETLGRILAGVAERADPFAGIDGLLSREQLVTLVQGTAGAFTGEVDRRAWRAGLVHALSDARGRGDAWAREVELFSALLALIDEQKPSLAQDHPYAEVLKSAALSAELAQDPTVLAMNAWLNADRAALIDVWREHQATLRTPDVVASLAALAQDAAADDDPALAGRIQERLALLRDCLARGEAALAES